MEKKEVKKSIWKECWDEYVSFVTVAWKDAWGSLKDALLLFLDAVFNWLNLIIAAVFGGLWNVIILPLVKWLKEKTIELIEWLKEKIVEWIKRI